ncbi:unnamed protein product [Microthlaspi erraticum]|uniref:BHLH domain-containing protein n=1 Tax=Microthlaspi erraticum TaxID=1685480 RepID=A0A6D2KVT7_9BRAS|nr:unnamed protein product [Microthlaspi erraticum]
MNEIPFYRTRLKSPKNNFLSSPPSPNSDLSLINMLNTQDVMELGRRNDVGWLDVKDQGISERARSDEDRLINGLTWGYGYFDHDQTAAFDLRRSLYIHPEEDELDEFSREVPSVTRKGSKRRKRDEMMSNKMRTLQQLVPNCYKTDKVSVLDKAIEYMKHLQLQLQVLSITRMNPYISPATLNFGMHNHLLTAMTLSQLGTSSPLIPAANWPLSPYTNFALPHSYQSLFLTTASSPQYLCGLVPGFPSFLDFPSHTMGRL